MHTIRVNIYSIKMQMESKHAIAKLVNGLMNMKKWVDSDWIAFCYCCAEPAFLFRPQIECDEIADFLVIEIAKVQ